MDGAGMGLFWIWPALVLIAVVLLLGSLAYRLTHNRGPGPRE